MGKKKSIGKSTSETSSRVVNTYRVVVLSVDKGFIDKVLWTTTNRKESYNVFNKEKTKSNKVHHAKRVNKSGHVFTPYNAKLCLMRKVRPSDEGKELFNGKWVILDETEYYEEETFIVWGIGWKDKKTLKEITQHINEQKTYNREIGVLNNKVLVYNDEYLDILTAKTPEEGRRLGIKLYKELNSPKKYNLKLDYTKEEKTALFDFIMECTGWSRRVVKKTRT